jgi:hypothetical protein
VELKCECSFYCITVYFYNWCKFYCIGMLPKLLPSNNHSARKYFLISMSVVFTFGLTIKNRWPDFAPIYFHCQSPIGKQWNGVRMQRAYLLRCAGCIYSLITPLIMMLYCHGSLYIQELFCLLGILICKTLHNKSQS